MTAPTPLHAGNQSPSTPASTPASAEVRQYAIASRWGGHESLAQDGFVPVVVPFLKYAAQLTPFALTPAEMVFVLQLLLHKWDSRAPYPSYATIAERMGVSTTYARRIGRDLERKGLLRRRIRRGTTNRFELQPLFDKLARYADEKRALAAAASEDED